MEETIGPLVQAACDRMKRQFGCMPSLAWKHETCETCEFQVDGVCRRAITLCPGARGGTGTYAPVLFLAGPSPGSIDQWQLACAQWQRATPDKEMSDEC